jgi:hypothetical protein
MPVIYDGWDFLAQTMSPTSAVMRKGGFDLLAPHSVIESNMAISNAAVKADCLKAGAQPAHLGS